MSPRAIGRSAKAPRSSKAPASPAKPRAAAKATSKAKTPAKKPAPAKGAPPKTAVSKPAAQASKAAASKPVTKGPPAKATAAKGAPAKAAAAKAPSAPRAGKPIPPPRASSRSLAAQATQITVGCAGFPVPATRYFKEFLFVEVQETHVALPGSGTLRRWRREAPFGFTFSMLAPREIGQEGFRDGKVVESALKSLIEVGKELDSKAAVFVAPPEFQSGRANRSAVKDFLQAVKRRFDRVVWEPPPGWDADDAAALAEEVGAIAARDPLMHGLTKGSVAYYRLHGPAGHKSRYEDPAIDKLAELAADGRHKEATYVFTNVDMFADAKRFKKALRL